MLTKFVDRDSLDSLKQKEYKGHRSCFNISDEVSPLKINPRKMEKAFLSIIPVLFEAMNWSDAQVEPSIAWSEGKASYNSLSTSSKTPIK